MIVPSLIAGSIFTFSLSLGDYIAVKNVGGTTQMLGNLVFDRQATDIPFAAALATVSVVIMVDLPCARAAHRRLGEPMSAAGCSFSAGATWGCAGWSPWCSRSSTCRSLVVVINSFNDDRTFSWPPTGFTLDWWRAAANSCGLIDSLQQSLLVGAIATAFALVLGTLAAFALQRYRFFGKQSVSLLIILPIALPGIVTASRCATRSDHHRHRPVAVVAGDRARDLLHRRCLQQRGRPAAATRRQHRGGVDGPRRHPLDHVPLVTLPNLGSALLAGGCWPSRCRSTRSW